MDKIAKDYHTGNSAYETNEEHVVIFKFRYFEIVKPF